MSKYRPFKNIDEFYNFLSVKDDARNTCMFYRSKKDHCFFHEAVFSLSYNSEGELLNINKIPVRELFDDYEYYRKGEWIPFGVKINDQD